MYKTTHSPHHYWDPVVRYGCESWTLKKAEGWRIDAFEWWWWRRLLRVPWTAGRSNQSILKEISPGCSLEGLMLKLNLQYFGHLMGKTDSWEKTLMLGKIEGRRRRGWQRMRRLDGTTDSMDMSLSKLWELWWTGKPGVLPSMGLQRDTTEHLNWTKIYCALGGLVNFSTPSQLWRGWENTVTFDLILCSSHTEKEIFTCIVMFWHD